MSPQASQAIDSPQFLDRFVDVTFLDSGVIGPYPRDSEQGTLKVHGIPQGWIFFQGSNEFLDSSLGQGAVLLLNKIVGDHDLTLAAL